MEYRVSYPFKIWATAAVLGSTLFYWGTYFYDFDVITHGSKISDLIAMYLTTIVVAFIFSIPTVLLLWAYIHLLTKTTLAYKTIKLLIAIACAFLCTITFLVFSKSLDKSTLLIILCYSIPLIAGVFIYKLNTVNNEV